MLWIAFSGNWWKKDVEIPVEEKGTLRSICLWQVRKRKHEKHEGSEREGKTPLKDLTLWND